MTDHFETLMATVYVKSESGRSLLREGATAPMDPGAYRPSPAAMEKVVSALEQLGFRIEAKGVTLSISGPPELFKEACAVSLSREEKPVSEPLGAKNRTMRIFRSSQAVMHIPELDDLIEGIVLSTPGYPLGGHDVPE